MAKKKEPIAVSVQTPLPVSVLSTLTALIEAAWPGTTLGPVPVGSNQVVFLVPDIKPRVVAPAEAAGMVSAPAPDGDLDVYGLGPDGIRVGTPVEVAQALLPVLQAAFEANPDAENYLEMPIRDPEAKRTYLLTFARSADQTPHQLRAIAEDNLADARTDISVAHMRVLQRLLLVPHGESPDTFAAGVKAAMNAVRELNFGRRGIED